MTSSSRSAVAKLIHLPTGEEVAFVRRRGVYFIELRFVLDVLQPDEFICGVSADQDVGSGRRS